MSVAKRLLSGDAYAFETVTVQDSAKSLTSATFAPSGQHYEHIRAIITATGGVMRYRYDGGSPTAGAGHLLSHGDMVIIEGGINVTNFKAIRAGSVNGSLSVTYEVVHG